MELSSLHAYRNLLVHQCSMRRQLQEKVVGSPLCLCKLTLMRIQFYASSSMSFLYRFMQLTAPDIRRATVQLLKTSVQHKPYSTESQAESASHKMEEAEGNRSSNNLPASLTQLTSLLRSNSASKPKTLISQKKILQQSSIPDIGVAWKIPR